MRQGCLVVPKCGEAVDSHIKNLCDFFRHGDVMVFNDTKVIPARLLGKRGDARVEVLLHKGRAGRARVR